MTYLEATSCIYTHTCRDLAYRQRSWQAVKVSQHHGNAAYQTVSPVCWLAVKVSRILGMQCTEEQGLPDDFSHEVPFVLLYLYNLAASLPACRLQLLQPVVTGDSPQSVIPNKPTSYPQPPVVFFGLAASQGKSWNNLD